MHWSAKAEKGRSRQWGGENFKGLINVLTVDRLFVLFPRGTPYRCMLPPKWGMVSEAVLV